MQLARHLYMFDMLELTLNNDLVATLPHLHVYLNIRVEISEMFLLEIIILFSSSV